MRERGFSLIELVVVVAIASILTGMATLRFSEYIRRSNKEAQTRMLYAEIMQARLCAFTERREVVVKYDRSSFDVYSSEKVDVGPKLHIPLKYPISFNNDATFKIDERGIVVDLTAHSLCLEDVSDGGILDSLVVQQTQVSLGSRKEGGACAKGGITVR